MKLFYFLFLLLFLVSCTYVDYDDVDFRTSVLYDHTLQMIELSNQTLLDKIGLDGSSLVSDPVDSQRLELLASAYGVSLTGDVDDDIYMLEEEMLDMMLLWVQE